jgi:hypothetical protein
MASIEQMIADLDRQIGKLQAARKALAEVNGATAPAKRTKRTISPEGRKRIVAAVKARWARARHDKAAAKKKAPAKKKAAAVEAKA